LLVVDALRTLNHTVAVQPLAKGEFMQNTKFTFDDMKKQLELIARPGLMQKMLKLIPSLEEAMGSEVRRMIGIIDAMTPEERRNPKLIDNSRRKRIARGSGIPPQDVDSLLRQHDMMKSFDRKNPLDRLHSVDRAQQAADEKLGWFDDDDDDAPQSPVLA